MKSNSNKITPQKQGPPVPEMIPFFRFYRYVTPKEIVLMVFGLIGAVIAGVLLPSLAIFMGLLTNTFDPTNSPDKQLDTMKIISGALALIGLGIWIFGYMYFAFWQHLAENVTFDLRSRYLHAILKQEIAFFEKQNIEQLPTQIGENFFIIQESIGEKFSNVVYTLVSVCSGVGIALESGVDFAAICLGFFPFLIIIMGMFGKKVKQIQIAKMEIVKQLGGVIEESLSAVKLIVSFANEEKEIKKFRDLANKVRGVAHKTDFFMAALSAVFRAFIFGFYCYALYIGTYYIDKKLKNPCQHYATYTTGDVLSVIMALLAGMTLLFGISPNMQAIVKAKVVGKEIFDVIDRVPEIKDHEKCDTEINLTKSIRFSNVTFKYPTAPEHIKNVLERVNFEIKAGQSSAIVGPSGSGKSTIIQMVERFYSPLEGDIFMDDKNIKDIKLKALRETIGYVSQEPVLIIGTIKENLLLGNKDATEDDIDYALRQANATFVYEMENKLDTYVGSSTVLNLSGGQKQRIAIARALIKKPKILILDEATSALDPKSEKEVQTAIDNIARGDDKLTIIMIAHRIQTIITAQNLLYLESKSSVIAGTKGTPEYERIMERLMQLNYAHQKGHDDESPSPQKKKKTDSDEELVKRIKTQVSEIQDDQLVLANQQAVKAKAKEEIGMRRIMSYYSPQILAYIAFCFSFINGFFFPVFGYIFTEILFVMLTPVSYSPTWYSDRAFWCGMMLLFTGLLGIVVFFEKWLYTYIGENLTFTIRTKLFTEMLYKPVEWFDNKERAPGILTTILAEDINCLNGLTTESISLILEAVLCLGFGVVLACIFNWKIALITLAVSPTIAFGSYMLARLQWKVKPKAEEENKDDPYNRSNALLSDIIINYRTVISFGEKNIDHLMKTYETLLQEPNKNGIKNAHFSGFWFGYSQGIRFCFIAFVFYICAIFIYYQHENPKDTYLAVYILFLSAIGSGHSISQTPSIGKAKAAATKIFDIIDEKSKIDSRSTEGIKEIKSGEIQLVDAVFRYPSRKKKVLNKLNMKINATQKIALVGHSGCGKSTIANLLLRMYELPEGQLLIDGVDIKDYNIAALRKQIGIVMQEPLLFNMSIKDNILYGNDQADDMKVREVAEMANALQFIESNIEDLEKEEVKIKIEQEFFSKLQQLSLKYQNLSQLEKAFEWEEKRFDLINLTFEILQKADQQLLEEINSNADIFKNVALEKIKTLGIRWDDIVQHFENQLTKNQIIVNIKSYNLSSFQEQVLTNGINGTKKWVDAQLIKEFKKAIDITERDNELPQTLATLIDASQERIRHDNYLRIRSIVQKTLLNKDGTFTLHEGFNKNCGLKGAKLSGGQKQRIAIARALIKDPKILILDEATSALDEQSQEIVQQALDRAMEGRTSVVIAHRLSTIRNCNLLFVINKGQVVESGTYDDLSADPNSYFSKLKSGMEM